MLKKVAALAAGRWLSKPENRRRAKASGQKLLDRFSSSSSSSRSSSHGRRRKH